MSRVQVFYFIFLIIIAALTPSHGQDFGENRNRFQIKAFSIQDPIQIDGLLREATWQNAEVAEQFFRVLPIDSGQAISQSEVSIAYDETTLYMAITCYDTFPGKRPAESLRRDFSFGKNDNFLVFMDTYNDQTNGFSFGISAAGAQWDGLQANGGFVSLDWDCKWQSAVHNDPDKWTAEFAIPFRSIRYQNGVKEWGINFSRLDLKSAEKSSWAPVPRQFQTANLAFTGTLLFDDAPPSLGTRFSLIPYVSARSSNSLGQPKDIGSIDAGFDAKVTLSTSMNLDLTVNPDFSQVEVDQQVTNLDRFELFFPERRQFFLENSDLYASLGSETIRPFFSRRIGLEVPVYAGARLSGKVDQSTRFGLMNIQTGAGTNMPASNFTVAAVQKQVFSRSNFGLFVVNKNLTGSFDGDLHRKHNRIVGVDYNLASADNKWTGKAFYHHALYPGSTGNTFATAGNIKFETQRISASIEQEYVGRGFDAEVGFVRRTGYYMVRPAFEFRFLPTGSKIASHGPLGYMRNFYNLDFDLTDQEIGIFYEFQLTNRSSFGASFTNTFIKLIAPFDPTNTGGRQLELGEGYRWSEAAIYYSAASRSQFNFDIWVQYGDYFNGSRFVTDLSANFRIQPYGSLGLAASFNDITLPAPYNSADLFLLGPKLDITFSEKIFLTTYLQYNDQIDNVNLNVRFQWRYKPVSDFFIVYSSNHFANTFNYKNRAIVAKLSYYFN